MSRKTKRLPLISFIIPTLNSGKYLAGCLNSIKKQDYPKGRIETLIIDGGSRDRTIKIAKAFKAKILKNPHVDAESGKSIGIRRAKGEIVCLFDSDNEIVQKDWLREMVEPMVRHKDLWGVESPWLLNENDGVINKYFTLLQVADPVARKFHPVSMKEKKYKNYVVLEPKRKVPVVGANGFLWRKSFIEQIGKHTPKFEEVNYVSLMMKGGRYKYAKHKKAGIYHYYTDGVAGYVKKRLKIGRKFLERKSKKQPTWTDRVSLGEFLRSFLYNALIVGPSLEAIGEYRKSRQVAWILHPFFSLLTVVVYVYTTIERLFKRPTEMKINQHYQSARYGKDSVKWRKEVYYPMRTNWLVGQLPTKISGKVLDAGCGDGGMSEVVKKNYPSVDMYGVDISKKGVGIAKKRGIKTKVADLNKKIPYGNNFFDFVIAHEVIEHLVDPDTFLEESVRVLKKGGYLVVTTPNLAAWYHRILFLFGYYPLFSEMSTKTRRAGIGLLKYVIKNDKPVGHIRIFTMPALTDLISFNGFKIVNTKASPIAFNFPRPLRLFYDTLDYLFSYRPTLGSNLLVVAKKK